MKFWGKLLLLIYNHSTWKDNGKNGCQGRFKQRIISEKISPAFQTIFMPEDVKGLQKEPFCDPFPTPSTFFSGAGRWQAKCGRRCGGGGCYCRLWY